MDIRLMVFLIFTLSFCSVGGSLYGDDDCWLNEEDLEIDRFKIDPGIYFDNLYELLDEIRAIGSSVEIDEGMLIKYGYYYLDHSDDKKFVFYRNYFKSESCGEKVMIESLDAGGYVVRFYNDECRKVEQVHISPDRIDLLHFLDVNSPIQEIGMLENCEKLPTDYRLLVTCDYDNNEHGVLFEYGDVIRSDTRVIWVRDGLVRFGQGSAGEILDLPYTDFEIE